MYRARLVAGGTPCRIQMGPDSPSRAAAGGWGHDGSPATTQGTLLSNSMWQIGRSSSICSTPG